MEVDLDVDKMVNSFRMMNYKQKLYSQWWSKSMKGHFVQLCPNAELFLLMYFSVLRMMFL